MKNRILFSVLALVAVTLFAQGKQKDFVLQSGQPVAIACSGSEAPVVRTSLDLLSRDLQTVLSATAHVDTNTGNILVGTIGQSKLIEQAGIDISVLKNKKQAFLLTVSEDGKLVVGDVFLETTLKNIKANEGKIAISAYDTKSLEGYQIKGTAEYVTEGAIVAAFKTAVEGMFKGAATAKGALIITPSKVIVTTPGADNKKEI